MKNPKQLFSLVFMLAWLLGVQPIVAQVWQNSYPGIDAIQGDVVPTQDGGFLASCAGQYLAFKTDGNGVQQWTFTLPDSIDSHYGGSVAVLPDGNYLVVGSATVSTPSFHGYVFSAKLAPDGSVLWLHFYPDSATGSYGHSIAIAPGGSIFIGAPYNFLAKTDANGNLLWQFTTVDFSVKDLIATADGGAIFLLNYAVMGAPAMILRKVDAAGNMVWQNSLPAFMGGYIGRSIAATSDGGFVLTGFLDLNDPQTGNVDAEFLLMRFDGNGNMLWENIPAVPGVEVGQDIAQTQDGGYIVTGWKSTPVSRYVWLWRFDALGNLLWEKPYFNGEGLGVKELSDGGLILLTRGMFLVRTNAQGVVFQNKIQGNVGEDLNGDCSFQPGEPGISGWLVATNGPFSAAAYTDANGHYEIPVDTGSYQLSFTPPQYTWQPCQASLATSFTANAENHDVGYYMAQAVAQTTSTISGYVFIDSNGDCVQNPWEIGAAGYTVWAATESNYQTPQWTAVTDENGFYSFTLLGGTGYYSVYLPNSSNNPYCQACDNDWFQFLGTTPVTHNIGIQCPSPSGGFHLMSYVFFDENKNCQPDFGEHGLETWTLDVVKIGTQDTFQILATDFPGGHFAVPVDTGNYQLTITPPNYLYLPCQFTYTTFVGSNGSIPASDPPLNIPLMPLADCPKLRVDVGTSFLSPCRPAVYHVQYCNDGTAAADDAFVEVTFPPSLTLDSSEITGVALPSNVWRFQLGDVPVDSCGSFWINASLDCADTVGLTYCVDAHIYPDSICGPQNLQWDGSSVELGAVCMGDSVVLTISNAGWGNMSQPLNFIVVEDNVLIKDSTFQLPAGGNTSVTVYPNGAAIIMSAQQAAGHPGMSMPMVFVEGCGGDSISLGFVTQYPQNDADCFLATDCHESVAALDPNTKEAQPKGVTAAHFIENTTELTYQITFQNLGTAPAETVVILDTLSEYLDTTRLQLGASSHPYSFELLPPNVLKFTFNDIQLPQASLDYNRSIGFVKFRLNQHPGNQPGTEIHNRAGIYFDFNTPVITNTVTHRIPAPQMLENQKVTLCAGDSWNGQVFTTSTTLVDTVSFAFFDSFLTTLIGVLPTMTETIDTSVVAGALVFDVMIVSDTSFVLSFMDDTGHCVERTINAHVLSAANPGLSNLTSLAMAPNPAKSSFLLSGTLTSGAFCDAKLLSAFGRNLVQLFENEWMTGSFHRTVDVQELPAGLYFLSFSVNGERQVMKLVVE